MVSVENRFERIRIKIGSWVFDAVVYVGDNEALIREVVGIEKARFI